MRSAIALLVLVLFTACSTAKSPAPPTARATDHPIITRLVSRTQTIVVRSTPTGPTYSLESKDGATLIPAMTLDQLALAHPDLFHQLRTLQTTTAWAGL